MNLLKFQFFISYIFDHTLLNRPKYRAAHRVIKLVNSTGLSIQSLGTLIHYHYNIMYFSHTLDLIVIYMCPRTFMNMGYILYTRYIVKNSIMNRKPVGSAPPFLSSGVTMQLYVYQQGKEGSIKTRI